MYIKTTVVFIVFIFLACDSGVQYILDDNPYITRENVGNLEYLLIAPENFNADSTYPVLITFPPGDQTKTEVEWAINKYWISQSIQQGWLIASPWSPDGDLFYEGNEDLIPSLMQSLDNDLNIEGDKFHLAGISNGGKSAFRVALQNNALVQSLTVFPGAPPTEADEALLNRLVDIPVTMYVGAGDSPDWIAAMETADSILTALGGIVEYNKMSGEGHVINGLSSEVLFKTLNSHRPD